MDGNGFDIAGGAHMYNGVNVGNAENRFNVPNKAIVFAYGFYSLPPAVYITQSDYTVTVWVKISKVTAQASIFDFGNDFILNEHKADNFVFEVSAAMRLTPYACLYQNGKYFWLSSSSVLLNVNTWYHLALVFERDTWYIYRNGFIIATRPSTPQLNNIIRSKSFIGRNNWFPGDEPLIGVMDDMRIYHKALSATEIIQVMNEDN